MLVVSNRTGHQVLERYKRRWQIEVLFEALKTCPRLERGTHQRPAKSLFRYGFDGIRQAVLNATDKWVQFERLLSLLWKALTSPKTILYPI